MGDQSPRTPEPGTGDGISSRRFERTSNEPDWDAIAESREFRELLASRRRFLVPAVTFFSGYFLAFLGLLAWAPDTMAKQVLGSISWALILGSTIILLAFAMAWLYSRKSAEWRVLAERVASTAGALRMPAEGGAR